jgi:hypothetical protein
VQTEDPTLAYSDTLGRFEMNVPQQRLGCYPPKIHDASFCLPSSLGNWRRRQQTLYLGALSDVEVLRQFPCRLLALWAKRVKCWWSCLCADVS